MQRPLGQVKWFPLHVGYAAIEVEMLTSTKDRYYALIHMEKVVEINRVRTAVQLIASVPTVIVMVTDIAPWNAQSIMTLKQACTAVLC